jgi:hypothetical protein
MKTKKVVRKVSSIKPKRKIVVPPEVYIENDNVIGTTQLPAVVAITVRISAKNVELTVGPRDWSWDRKTKKLIGAGTLVGNIETTADDHPVETEEVTTTAATSSDPLSE